MPNIEYYKKVGKHKKEIEFIERCLSDDYYKTEYKTGLSHVKTKPVDMAEKIAFAFKEIFTGNNCGRALKTEVLSKINDDDAEKILFYFERTPREYIKTEGEYLVLNSMFRVAFEVPSENIETLIQKTPSVEKPLEQAPLEAVVKENISEPVKEEQKEMHEIAKEIKETKEERQYKKEEQRKIKDEQKRTREETKEKAGKERLYIKEERKKINEEQKRINEEIKERAREEKQYKKQEQRKIKEEIREKAKEEKLYMKQGKEKIRKEKLEKVYSSVKSAYDYANKPFITISFPDYKAAVKSAINPVYKGIESLLEKSNKLLNKRVILRNYHLVIVLPALLAGMYALGSNKQVMKKVDYCIDSCVKSCQSTFGKACNYAEKSGEKSRKIQIKKYRIERKS